MAPKKSTSPDKAPVPGSLAPKMEKVRNPTSRLGPKDPAGQPLESNRPAESSRKTKKESKTERKGDDKKGSKADKDADSPPAKAEKAKETGSADKAYASTVIRVVVSVSVCDAVLWQFSVVLCLCDA